MSECLHPQQCRDSNNLGPCRWCAEVAALKAERDRYKTQLVLAIEDRDEEIEFHARSVKKLANERCAEVETLRKENERLNRIQEEEIHNYQADVSAKAAARADAFKRAAEIAREFEWTEPREIRNLIARAIEAEAGKEAKP